jgi:hypothetical protein
MKFHNRSSKIEINNLTNPGTDEILNRKTHDIDNPPAIQKSLWKRREPSKLAILYHMALLSCDRKLNFQRCISCNMALSSCDLKVKKRELHSVFKQIRTFAWFSEYIVILCLSGVGEIYGIQGETSEKFTLGIKISLFTQKNHIEKFERFLQDSPRFSKILQDSPRFSKILRDSPRFV